jgi:hypothetical protein
MKVLVLGRESLLDHKLQPAPKTFPKPREIYSCIITRANSCQGRLPHQMGKPISFSFHSGLLSWNHYALLFLSNYLLFQYGSHGVPRPVAMLSVVSPSSSFISGWAPFSTRSLAIDAFPRSAVTEIAVILPLPFRLTKAPFPSKASP